MKRRFRDLHRNLLWLVVGTVMWCLLWGELDVKTVLGGLLVAAFVHVTFPMPPLAFELAFRPLAFVHFVGRFLFDLGISAVMVSWFALRPGSAQPPSSVIAVQLASRSDLFLTGTAILSTLIPGSVVVEAQRATGTLFLHVIGAGTEEEVEDGRRRVLAQERRLLLALARRDVLKEAGIR